MNDGFEVELFGRKQGKTLLQVEAHLITEDAYSAGTGAVVFFRPLI